MLTLIKGTYYQQPRNSAEEEGVSWSLWEVSVQGSHRVPASWSRKLGLFLHTLSTSEHGPKEVFASSLSLTGGKTWPILMVLEHWVLDLARPMSTIHIHS